MSLFARAKDRLEALRRDHPSLVPIVGAGAGVIAAYVGIVALRRGSASSPTPVPAPVASSDLSGGGLLGGLPYDPIHPTVNVGPGGGFDPFTPPPAALPTSSAAPTSRLPTSSGGSRGTVAPTRYAAPATSPLTAVPTTRTPAGNLGAAVRAMPFVQANPIRFYETFYALAGSGPSAARPSAATRYTGPGAPAGRVGPVPDTITAAKLATTSGYAVATRTALPILAAKAR